MKTVFKITFGIVLAGLLLMGGCAALIGGAANEVVKESDKSAITQAQFDSIEKGATKDEVTEALKPAVFSNEQTTEVDSGETGMDLDSTCIYYNKESFADGMYQFCFDGSDKMTTKASY
jgi:hypothetical protein